MRFASTRGGQEADLLEAVMQGLARDGGLFVPMPLPHFEPGDIEADTFPGIAAELLQPFFAGSPLESQLVSICNDALDFDVPLVRLRGAPEALSVLELFHGPTAAFKDVGARFLAAFIERARRLVDASDGRPITILVATSGDTGGAVAAAFHGRQGVRVAVLYPRGQVSPRQEHQLTCWGGNVRAFEVDGSFDDCQAMVKAAFTDPSVSARHRLNAANSINLGRLLPQVAYHAAASLRHWREHGRAASFVVPTGNLGNGLACVWARAMGMPIERIVLAVNANRTLPDYLATGDWQPRPSVATLASAMDVGNPSNMERLQDLMPSFEQLRESVAAFPVDDDSIRAQIARDYERFGRVSCPHTATGFFAYDHLPEADRSERSWIVCATAHPAKFETIVEPIIGRPVDVPEPLEALLARPVSRTPLEPRFDALAAALDRWKGSD